MKNKIVIAALLCLLLLGLGGTALAEEYCPVCNGPIIYLDPDYEDETSHIIVGDCIDCNEFVITFKEHYGGTATCTQKAVCSGCGGEYGRPLGHSWQTNNGTHSCTRSGCTVSETCSGTDDGDCTTALNCSTCGYTINSAQAAHDYTGAPATCTTPQICARTGCETSSKQPSATTTAARPRPARQIKSAPVLAAKPSSKQPGDTPPSSTRRWSPPARSTA